MSAPAVVNRVDLIRQGQRLEYFTVAWNTLEAAISLVAGFIADWSRSSLRRRVQTDCGAKRVATIASRIEFAGITRHLESAPSNANRAVTRTVVKPSTPASRSMKA